MAQIADLTEYEALQLQKLRAWKLDPPGPAARGFARATGPATRAMQAAIPVGALRKALNLAHQAGRRLADEQWVLKRAKVAAAAELQSLSLEALDQLTLTIQRRAMGMAGAGGMLFGVAGAAGLVADVPALLVLALRSIHRLGLCYGEASTGAGEDRLAIGIFALASANTMGEKQTALRALAGSGGGLMLQDAAWRDGIERAAERELAKEAAVMSLNNLARQLGLNLGWRKAGGALPVIGAAVGGSVNAWYLYDVTRTAQFCYQERWLQRRYPELASIRALPDSDN